MSAPPLLAFNDPRFRKGIALFNRGEFFECHEALEAVWLEAAGEEKQFLQGLIQVAVAFYHLRRENFVGASRLLHAGLNKLRNSELSSNAGNIPSLLEQLAALPERMERGEVRADWPHPQISFGA